MEEIAVWKNIGEAFLSARAEEFLKAKNNSGMPLIIMVDISRLQKEMTELHFSLQKEKETTNEDVKRAYSRAIGNLVGEIVNAAL